MSLGGLYLEGLIFGISWHNMIACSLAVLIYNNKLVTEVEVASGGHLPSCDERSEPRGSLGRLFHPNFYLFCPTAEPGPRLMLEKACPAPIPMLLDVRESNLAHSI